MSLPLTVVGIDPGTTVTGYGVVRREGRVLTLLECGVIRPTPKTPLPARIREIFEGIAGILDAHVPGVVAVESVFQGKNARSALVLGHARGAILLAAELRGISIAEYTPVAIKKAVVGHGSATKEQVGRMVQERLRLAHPPRPNDAADGVAAALSHLVLGHRIVPLRRSGALARAGVRPRAGREGEVEPQGGLQGERKDEVA